MLNHATTHSRDRCSTFNIDMRNRVKAIIAYFLFGIHLGALIYFGMTIPCKLFEWSYIKYISILMILLGSFVYLSGYLKLGVNKSSGTNYSELINSGIYKFIRNPQILGWMCILTGISFYLNSLISLALSFAFWMIFKIVLQPSEERILTKKYGRNYLKYKRETISGI